MATSRDLPADRLAIGPLLVRLLRQFRAELFEPAAGHGYPDLREPTSTSSATWAWTESGSPTCPPAPS